MSEKNNNYTADENLKVFLDNISDIFYVISINGVFLYWNKAFEKISGYSSEEIKNMNVIDFFDERSAVRITDAIKTSFENGFNEIEESFYTKDGRRVPMLYSATLVHDKSGNPVLCGTGKEITFVKKIQDELNDRIREMEILIEAGMQREDRKSVV